MSVEDIDRGWDEIVGAMQGLAGKELRVGILGNAPKPEGTDLTMAGLGTIHEFGAPKANIPARSFMRSTFDERQRTYEQMLSSMMRRLGPGMSATRMLRLLGTRMVADVQRKITTLQEPPLKPATIARKGSANPLIDTGRMRQSVNFEIKG